MKPGTKIRSKFHGSNMNREVRYFGPHLVVYAVKRSDGSEMEYALDRVDFSIKFESVPDFFEEGKTYIRDENPNITFEVEHVRENEGEAVAHHLRKLSAYGAITSRDSEGEVSSKEWAVVTGITWNGDRWSERV